MIIYNYECIFDTSLWLKIRYKMYVSFVEIFWLNFFVTYLRVLRVKKKKQLLLNSRVPRNFSLWNNNKKIFATRRLIEKHYPQSAP